MNSGSNMETSCKMDKMPVSPSGWEYIDDLSVIPEDHDVIDFLLHRAECGRMYTWVGPLLLSANPENAILDDLYDESHQRQYSKNVDMVLRNATPHVYAIANRARYRLVHSLGKISQVIIVSGESGTGKTFNSRRILEFLVGIDKNAPRLEPSDGASKIAHEIGNVCPLISAFTTARTEHNPNSSRHGQLLQLQYKNGRIVGACVNSLLLERTRVTDYSNNFDIFYQILFGLSPTDLKALDLSWDDNYGILGDNHTLEKQRYQKNFVDTMKAMETLSFTQLCKDEILQVLALLLHMGNIKFRVVAGEHCMLDTADEESSKAVLNSCKISKLQERELEDLLTTTLICPTSTRRRHTMYRRDLRTAEACRHRLFSIIRWIYDRLFHSLVDRINSVITAKEDDCHCLGILDIFGFESLETNGIEQLCINYTTECLQMYFMEEYLDSGQKELEEEGLNIIPPPPTLSIYRNRLSVIEQSLFCTMNDACQAPTPPSVPIVSKQLIMRQSNARNFITPQSHSFIINHYSRPVEYDIYDILEKNTDKVPSELSNTFQKTENSLLKLVTIVPDDIYNDRGRVSVKKGTTLSKLKSSMDSLTQQLNKCDTHYVRCVRPKRMDNSWLKAEFREQLACSGILDALPLARCKFPIRLTYQEFSTRYSLPAMSNDFKLQFQAALEKIMDFENIACLMHLGNKRIFLTESLFFELERYRKELRASSVNKIATFWLNCKSKRANAKDRSNEETLEIENPVKALVKPAIMVTRPSLPGFEKGEDSYSNGKSPTKLPIADVKNEINNNIVEMEAPPQIALNDLIVEHMSPMNTGVHNHQLRALQVDSNSVLQRKNVNPHNDNADIIQKRLETGKDRYVAEWLVTIPATADVVLDESDVANGYSQRFEESLMEGSRQYGKFRNFIHNSSKPVFKGCSKTEWSPDGTNCVIDVGGCERLFYKNRVLSRRRLSEVPIKFHTRTTCLVNSHYLPQLEIPRGLQDCC